MFNDKSLDNATQTHRYIILNIRMYRKIALKILFFYPFNVPPNQMSLLEILSQAPVKYFWKMFKYLPLWCFRRDKTDQARPLVITL